MKRRRILPLFLAVILVISAVPTAFAYEAGEPCTIDLSSFIHDREKREYVEMMVDHHIRTDRDIQNALDGGFSAVFLFDGCSDHMNDPELSNLSYYRVSGICLVVNRNAAGELKLAYFNDDASTIPDQPLKYGAWTIPEVGEVGPATICDGTYQLYSILHRGEYEALHVRSDFRDGTLEAIYLTPDGGHTSYRASEINVHTRTSNHIANYGMWSAGCPLVGDGNALEYSSLIRSTYYTSYDSFDVMNFVGTLTIDRQMLRQELYTLYKNPDAVDACLVNSREVQPDRYFADCSNETVFEAPEVRIASTGTSLMSLPCTQDEDARTIVLKEIPKGEKLTVTGSIRNADQQKWYRLSYDGTEGYLFTGDTKPESLWSRFLEWISGK